MSGRKNTNDISFARPSVSVIIPTYNRANIVVRALESVLHQTYPPLEIIVADDGSTDGTKDVIKGFGKNTSYLPLPHSGLPAVVRNAGLRIAKGELVAFLDDDDEWLPDKLSRQVEVMNSDLGIGLVCTNALVRNSEENLRKGYYLKDGQGRSGKVFAELLENNFVITSTVLVRRSVLGHVGIFCESSKIKSEDYDLWLRIANRGKIAYIAEPFAIYCDTPAISIRGKHDAYAYWQGFLLILDRLQRDNLLCKENASLVIKRKIRILTNPKWKLPLWRRWLALCKELIALPFRHPKILLNLILTRRIFRKTHVIEL